MMPHHSHLLLLLLPLLLAVAPPTVRAQETEPPPAESEAAAEPTGEAESTAATEQEGGPQEEEGEEEGAPPQEEEGGEGEEAASSEEPATEAGTEPQESQETPESEAGATAPASRLSPEEQARLEKLKRKREERAAKRAAKKAREAAKQEKKRLAREAEHAEHLAEVLTQAEEALEAGRLDKARQAFEKHMELEGGESYDGRLGLARLELVAENPAAAVEQALKAVKASGEGAEKARALSFAAGATLAARPRDESSGEPLPGTEIFQANALRYYMQALTFDPEGASEARQALEQAFPAPEDERTERFYSRYLESSEIAPGQHAKRLASTYEALLSGRIEGPLAVIGGIRAPEKIAGPQPPYPQDLSSENIRRRLLVDLVVEADGSVSAARVLNGLDPRRDRAAEAVMRQWTFEPARLPGGDPVAVHYAVVTNADVQPLPVAVTAPTPGEETVGEEAAGEQSESLPPDQEAAAVETPAEGDPSEDPSVEGVPPVETSGEEGVDEPPAGEATTEDAPAESSPPQGEGTPPGEPQAEGDQDHPERHQ